MNLSLLDIFLCVVIFAVIFFALKYMKKSDCCSGQCSKCGKCRL